MNKQELIEKINAIPWDEGLVVDTLKINRAGLIQLIEQFDELQKVTVPQFVADWIEYCKNTFLSLVRSLMVDEVDFYNYANQKDHSRLIDFLGSGINQETFARAWLDGYTVEKEKRYIVKFKNIQKGTEYLKYDRVIKKWYFGLEEYSIERRIYHTRKKLEEADFGWVFDCPGVEIEEVE